MYSTQFKFAKINEAIKQSQLQNPHKTIFNMGRGEPTDPPHPTVIETLKKELDDPLSHRYTDNTGADFLEAAATYLQNLYNVALDPTTEIIHAIGIKSALSILPKCFFEPGRGGIALTTSPGYDVFPHHTRFLGAEVVELILKEENNFLPDLASISPETLKKTKVLLLNYPNNPTGKMPSKAFYEEIIDWAIKHKIVIINDASYGPLVYNQPPFSIFQIKGAKDVAIELHSLSKVHNMPGWRIGFVCGNPQIIKTYSTFKNFADSGQFLPIQKAAATALNNLSTVTESKEKYSRRLDQLVSLLNSLGFQAKKPDGAFYLYLPAPMQVEYNNCIYEFSTAEAFSLWLIEHLSIVTIPWDEVSPHVRFSITFKAFDDKLFFEELRNRLDGIKFCLKEAILEKALP